MQTAHFSSQTCSPIKCAVDRALAAAKTFENEEGLFPRREPVDYRISPPAIPEDIFFWSSHGLATSLGASATQSVRKRCLASLGSGTPHEQHGLNSILQTG